MLYDWTLDRVLTARAGEHPERTALVANGRAVTYAQVNAKAAALAAALAELGIGAGDRIAIVMPNWSEWVIALLAASKLGSTVVPVNPRLSYHELKYQLRHAEVSAVVAVEHHHGIDYLQIFEDMLSELPDLLYLITVGGEELWYDDRIFQFEDLLSSGAGRDLPSSKADDGSDLALIYTSGTMGKPKGVRLSHRAIVEMAQQTGELLEMEPADRVLAMVPFFTLFGLNVLIGVLAAGATLVLQDEFDATGAVALLQRERVTVMHGVPMMYQLIMRTPEFDPAGFPSLRTGIVAGGAVSEELVRRIRRWCNVQLAYGLTETGPTMTMTRFSDPEGGGCRHRCAARARSGRRACRPRAECNARICSHADGDRPVVLPGRLLPHW